MMCYLIRSGMPRYAVSVRQYRPLQSRLLQCMNHFKPPYDLLMLPCFTTAHKRLSLSGIPSLKELYLSFRAHTLKLPPFVFVGEYELSLNSGSNWRTANQKNRGTHSRNVGEFDCRNFFNEQSAF